MLPYWLLASILANVSINVIEYLNRVCPPERGFIGQLVYTGPLIVVAQFGLFHAWKGAPSMMLAWACFSAMNSAMRLVSNSLFLDEPLQWRGWAGVTVMFIGMYLVKTAK
jgi:drug/metabolite transporter (DMT)-like permease